MAKQRSGGARLISAYGVLYSYDSLPSLKPSRRMYPLSTPQGRVEVDRGIGNKTPAPPVRTGMEFSLPIVNCGEARFSTVGVLGDVWVEIPGNAPYQLVWLPIVLQVPLGILPGANVRAVSHLSLAAIGSAWLLAWYELTPAQRLEVGLPGECTPEPG